MSRFSPEEIRAIARLSRLEFSEAEIRTFSGQLGAILQYVEKLNELRTGDIEPTSHCLALTNVFRADEPEASLAPEAALANAPESEAGCFRVPPIVPG